MCFVIELKLKGTAHWACTRPTRSAGELFFSCNFQEATYEIWSETRKTTQP